ncbi:hypothetical protein SAMN05421823_102127 [Catalinimonas alkaloidigena]|uniref:Uncharacterized protein n=1 Tax=Catalinimonas alkaloidigena TaxID=1075417 RepID=A0A1G9A180_9BACT|nr:hypothetical protein SAMN05421823_102127 [Catalinimonas alkaloidigena]
MFGMCLIKLLLSLLLQKSIGSFKVLLFDHKLNFILQTIPRERDIKNGSIVFEVCVDAVFL